ncbi:Major antigenlike, partial [Caligus rogercresseyi]
IQNTEAKIFKLEEDLKDSSLRTKELISENGDLNEQILDFESKYDALDEEANECRDAKDKTEREIRELREESAAKLEAATNSFNMEKSELL